MINPVMSTSHILITTRLIKCQGTVLLYTFHQRKSLLNFRVNEVVSLILIDILANTQ